MNGSVATAVKDNRSLQMIGASVLVAVLMATIWFGAPLVPVLLGGLGTGAMLAYRTRRG